MTKSKPAAKVALAKLATAVAAFLAIVVLMPGTAQAALNIPISGSTYSSATVWYESSNARIVTNDSGGNVDIQMDSRPKLSNGTSDQLKWALLYCRQYCNNITATTYIYNSNWYRDIDNSYIVVGSHFWNRYARYTTCNNCNHNFSGNMDY